MFALVTIPPSETDGTLVAAVANQIIVVRSLLIAAAGGTQSVTVRLKSNSVVMTPWLRAGTTATFQFESDLGQIATLRGETLRLENASSVDSVVTLITYDLLN